MSATQQPDTAELAALSPAGGTSPPAGTRRAVDRSLLSFPEKQGAWMLALAAIAAWVLAVVVHNDAVGTAFALDGLLLFAAAAFYSRVVKIGKEGVDLADVVDVIASTPVEDGDTASETKFRAIESVQRLAVPAAEASPPSKLARSWRFREALMERDRAEMGMLFTFNGWLQAEGYRVTEMNTTADSVRGELVAVRGPGERLFAELRPAIGILRASDAAAIAVGHPARFKDGDRRALVFKDSTVLAPEAIQVLLDNGIDMFKVDEDTGEISHTPAPPRAAREPGST